MSKMLMKLTPNILIGFIDRVRRTIIGSMGGVTLGARAIVTDEAQESVLLVKHTYRHGWHTPGGGVEPGETPVEAIIRELKEEVGINTTVRPQIFNIYKNEWRGSADYPIFFLITLNDKTTSIFDKAEIMDVQWFPLASLPEDVTPRTRKTLEEFLKIREINDVW